MILLQNLNIKNLTETTLKAKYISFPLTVVDFQRRSPFFMQNERRKWALILTTAADSHVVPQELCQK